MLKISKNIMVIFKLIQKSIQVFNLLNIYFLFNLRLIQTSLHFRSVFCGQKSDHFLILSRPWSNLHFTLILKIININFQTFTIGYLIDRLNLFLLLITLRRFFNKRNLLKRLATIRHIQTTFQFLLLNLRTIIASKNLLQFSIQLTLHFLLNHTNINLFTFNIIPSAIRIFLLNHLPNLIETLALFFQASMVCKLFNRIFPILKISCK